jgi:hypothetical protein
MLFPGGELGPKRLQKRSDEVLRTARSVDPLT